MRILALIDGSPAALQGARYGARLAKVTGGSVTLLHARSGKLTVPPEGSPSRWEEPVLRTARESLRVMGASVEAKTVNGTPAEAIPRELRSQRYDMVTLGSRGRGESGTPSRYLGSTALRVVRVSPVPVLLVRATEQGQPVGGEQAPVISTILVPTDGSLASLDAVNLAANLAEPLHAEVTLLHVQPATPPHGAAAGAQEDVLAVSQEPLLRRGVPTHPIQEIGEPTAKVLEHTRAGGFDLIIMGTYGAGEAWYRRVRMGSVAETVLIGAPCPVILVKQPADMDIS